MSKFHFLKRMLQRASPPASPPVAVAPGEAQRAPIADATAAPQPNERRAAARQHAREGLRVLVIDDSATIIAVLGKMLRQNNFLVSGAADAESGIETARTERPDLIYLDIVLPGMNGFDALRVLRRDPLTRDTPIIMISGNVQATEQFYVKRIGADDFMKKPFGRGEVFTRIQQLVASGRLPERAAPPAELLSDDGSVAPADAGVAGGPLVTADSNLSVVADV